MSTCIYLFCIITYVIQYISFLTFYLYNRFQNIRVPRENLLNLVADVLPDGQYVSMIDDPDQVSLSLSLSQYVTRISYSSFS